VSKTIEQARKDDRKSDRPVKRRPRRSAEETRRDILAKAEELFRERGFNAVAIADIAAALGMSPANVDAIAFEQIGAFERGIKPLDKSHAPLSRLRHLARTLMEQHHQDLNDNPYIFEMILMTAKQDMKCGDYYKAVIANLLADIIRDGIDARIYAPAEISPLAETVLHALTSVIHPVLIAREDIGNLATRCDQLVDLIDAGLRNPLAK
jgi:TetR/AcrR family transcriptional regulator, repressor of the ameABC operon